MFQKMMMGIIVLSVACAEDVKDAKTYEKEAVLASKKYVQQQLNILLSAAQEMKTLAPTPDADGWNNTQDKAAIDGMKSAWKKARSAYEHIEGSIAVLFPKLDISTDERYDQFIETDTDTNLFDDQTVTGVHAIERILWADSHPERVVVFESKLGNYVKAEFPKTQKEADDFKNLLCQKLISDVQKMNTEFSAIALDAASSFRGVSGSIAEQVEKISKAASAEGKEEEESRYAQHTLQDMRDNLEGGKQTLAAFREWLDSTANGASFASKIDLGFQRIEAAYTAVSGDALPSAPSGWDAKNSTEEHKNSAYGKLFLVLEAESNAEVKDSTVHSMDAAADHLGIPQLE